MVHRRDVCCYFLVGLEEEKKSVLGVKIIDVEAVEKRHPFSVAVMFLHICHKAGSLLDTYKAFNLPI